MKNMYIKYILSGLIVLGCNVSMADEVYRHLCSKADANNGVPGFTIVAGPLDLTFTDKELVVPAPLDTKLQLISKKISWAIQTSIKAKTAMDVRSSLLLRVLVIRQMQSLPSMPGLQMIRRLSSFSLHEIAVCS
jgi:hypothetical protein